MPPNDGIIVNNEWNGFGLARLWPNIRDYLGICRGRLEKTMKHLRIIGVRVNIRIKHLGNVSKERYHLNQLPPQPGFFFSPRRYH
jgi:hypothetical protein